MTSAPAHASADLEMHETEDGLIVYQESTDRVHYLNHTAAAVFELCDGRRSVEDIAEELRSLFALEEAPVAETEACLAGLVKEGVLRR
jgi:hypothetical protein